MRLKKFLGVQGGFDVVEMGDDLEIAFWNEYMTLEKSEWFATFQTLSRLLMLKRAIGCISRGAKKKKLC